MIKRTCFAAALLMVQMTWAVVTLNQKDTGYRGIWYAIGSTGDEYVYKYSGGLGTYCAKHRPFAIYRPEVNKTFFCYGGTPETTNTHLLHEVSYYDHQTGEVGIPTIVLDKQTADAHHNPVISVDDDGYIWIFSPDHGTGTTSYIHKSVNSYDIDTFVQIYPTRIDDGNNTVAMNNFSYPQPWHEPGQGFSMYFTRYNYPVERTICFMTSPDGITWSKWQRISTIGRGSYQISCIDGSRSGTAFNIHPSAGLDYRTNLYYVETLDNGQTWQAVDGSPLTLPLTDSVKTTTPALVRNYEAESLLVYMKDIMYDPAGNPVILYLTSSGWRPGPENDPRTWMIAHWSGTEWLFKSVTTSDNNYDGGSLYIEADGTWRIIGATESGPQEYNTGGELAMWTSSDQGNAWTKVKDMTQNSVYNHSYVRAPINARDDFYGIWADGHGREVSESCIYYCDKAGNVTRLPRRFPWLPPICDYPPEDLNKDCKVNLEDFAEFSSDWLGETVFSEMGSAPGDVNENFEVSSVGDLNGFVQSDGSSPVISTAFAHSGGKSLCWLSDVWGTYSMVPFGNEQVDCTASIRVYLDPETSWGRAYFSISDQSGAYIMLILNKDQSTGQFDLLHRLNSSTYLSSLTNLEPGWHHLGFVVHDNGAVGLYFDDQYIDTTQVIDGLYKIWLGKPWSGYAGCAVYYDDLLITQNNNFIGGASASPNDLYQDFEIQKITDLLSEGNYEIIGSPLLTNTVQKSREQSLAVSEANGKIHYNLPNSNAVNCRFSAWTYFDPVSAHGKGYAGACESDAKYCLIVTRATSPQVYYRFVTTVYYSTINTIDPGWHLMSFIVDYRGHIHMFFDNTYLNTYRSSVGLNQIRLGRPWDDSSYSYFDSMSMVYGIRGGFCGDWNTILRAGDFNQDCVEDAQDFMTFIDKWLWAQ